HDTLPPPEHTSDKNHGSSPCMTDPYLPDTQNVHRQSLPGVPDLPSGRSPLRRRKKKYAAPLYNGRKAVLSHGHMPSQSRSKNHPRCPGAPGSDTEASWPHRKTSCGLPGSPSEDAGQNPASLPYRYLII